jgi:hypothetical protein
VHGRSTVLTYRSDTGGAPAAAGEWVTQPRPLFVTAALYCTACGAMLHGRYWVGGDGAQPYCAPECRDLEQRVEALYVAQRGSEPPPDCEPP